MKMKNKFLPYILNYIEPSLGFHIRTLASSERVAIFVPLGMKPPQDKLYS